MPLSETVSRHDLAGALESLYRKYNRREFVSPDPLQFLYEYENPLDREIVAFIASSLAYGRVAMILRNVRRVLDVMGKSPREYVTHGSYGIFMNDLKGFKHRFTDAEDMACFLAGILSVLKSHGSLGGFMASEYAASGNIVSALSSFISTISGGMKNSLLADPAKGSACKRHFLMLRWLARCDDVDPGGWGKIPASSLIVPLDTHMYAVCRALGFTTRKAADLKTAREITLCFSRLCPEDPVKYDFVLTRFGIRDELRQDALIDFLGGDGNDKV